MTTAVPAAPGTLSLDSIAIAADAVMPIAGGSPVLTLVTVESGALMLNSDAPLTIFHAAGPPAQVAAGDAATISTGDSVLMPTGASGELLNAGGESASVMTLTVAPAP
jgi:hypothetical protein